MPSVQVYLQLLQFPRFVKDMKCCCNPQAPWVWAYRKFLLHPFTNLPLYMAQKVQLHIPTPQMPARSIFMSCARGELLHVNNCHSDLLQCFFFFFHTLHSSVMVEQSSVKDCRLLYTNLLCLSPFLNVGHDGHCSLQWVQLAKLQHSWPSCIVSLQLSMLLIGSNAATRWQLAAQAMTECWSLTSWSIKCRMIMSLLALSRQCTPAVQLVVSVERHDC